MSFQEGPTLMDQYWWTLLPVILRSWKGKRFTFVLLRESGWILMTDEPRPPK